MCVIFFNSPILQGLGLLINLVEYSARNRHCLVNMETSCSFDSLCTGEGDESLKITGQIDAVQALVQVRSVCPAVVPISHYQTVGRKGELSNENVSVFLFTILRSGARYGEDCCSQL